MRLGAMRLSRGRSFGGRSSRSVRGASLLAVLALAGPVALASAGDARGEGEPDATQETAEAGAASGAGAEAAASFSGAEGRIGFVGHNLFGDAPGTFSEWRVKDAVVDLANPAASEVRIEVALASVDTGNADRDEHLRTADFFDVAQHPVATVRGHSARPLEPSPEGHPRHALQFDVDLHGVRKSIDGEVEIVETDPLVVEGGFLILRTEFGIGAPPSRWNPMSIDDEVPVRFRIELD